MGKLITVINNYAFIVINATIFNVISCCYKGNNYISVRSLLHELYKYDDSIRKYKKVFVSRFLKSPKIVKMIEEYNALHNKQCKKYLHLTRQHLNSNHIDVVSFIGTYIPECVMYEAIKMLKPGLI